MDAVATQALEEAQKAYPDYAEAIAGLCEFVGDVLEALQPEGRRPADVSVYLFDTSPRIGELSAVWNRPQGGTAGMSWMRVDHECGGVLLCAEDFLLNYGEKGEIQTDREGEVVIDTENEARWRLATALGVADERSAAFLLRRLPRCPGCGVICANPDVEHLNDCRFQGRDALPFPATTSS